MNPRTALFTVLAVLASPVVHADDSRNLTEQIRSADLAFFSAVFDRCDIGAVGSMVADDLEFFHDKWGQIAKSGSEFVKVIDGGCQRQKQGTDFKARRRLVGASLVVYPMKGYGAIEMGEHEFFKVEADGRLTPTEYAKFTHLWREVDGRWLLARVLSYAHTDGPRPGKER